MHLCGPARSGASIERKQGFEEALNLAGLPADPAWIIEGGSQASDFEKAIRLFQLPKAERPTAIFAWSDDVAIQVMSILRGMGRRIPEDVSVIGFDSTDLCDHTDPPLTSIRQPITEMAKQALKSLSAQIRNEVSAPIQLRMLPTLNIRRSCAQCN